MLGRAMRLLPKTKLYPRPVRKNNGFPFKVHVSFVKDHGAPVSVQLGLSRCPGRLGQVRSPQPRVGCNIHTMCSSILLCMWTAVPCAYLGRHCITATGDVEIEFRSTTARLAEASILGSRPGQRSGAGDRFECPVVQGTWIVRGYFLFLPQIDVSRFRIRKTLVARL